LKKRDWSRIQAEEVNCLRTVKICTKTDPLRNEAVGKLPSTWRNYRVQREMDNICANNGTESHFTLTLQK
jgi:hypothetical protein